MKEKITIDALIKSMDDENNESMENVGISLHENLINSANEYSFINKRDYTNTCEADIKNKLVDGWSFNVSCLTLEIYYS